MKAGYKVEHDLDLIDYDEKCIIAIFNYHYANFISNVNFYNSSSIIEYILNDNNCIGVWKIKQLKNN